MALVICVVGILFMLIIIIAGIPIRQELREMKETGDYYELPVAKNLLRVMSEYCIKNIYSIGFLMLFALLICYYIDKKREERIEQQKK